MTLFFSREKRICSPALWSFLLHFSGPSPVSPWLSWIVGVRNGHSTAGLAWQVLRRVDDHVYICASNVPGGAVSDLPLLLQQHSAVACSGCCPPGPPGLFKQGSSPLSQYWAILGSLVMSSRMQDFVPVFVKLYTVLDNPLFQSIQVSLQVGFPFWRVHLIAQLGIISKLTKCAFNPIIQRRN